MLMKNIYQTEKIKMKLVELKRLKTFKVKKTFSGKYHADNHDQMKQDLISELKAHGIDTNKLTENDYGFSLGNRTWHKPKIKKESIGTITMRSKDYIFTNEDGQKSYGSELKASNMLDNGFRISTYDGNFIEYIILDGEV